jgi:phage terminase large subunit-like protein
MDLQHDLIWADELVAWENAQQVWDQAMFGLRVGKRPRAIITTTPRPIKIIRDLLKRDGLDVRVTRGRTADNAANLAPTFLETIVSRYQGTRLGRQELDAEILDDVVGALWSRDLIEQTTRRSAASPLSRIVVAIDPSVSSGEGANECGLIVAGLGVDGHGYVLADESGVMRRLNGSGALCSSSRFGAPTGSLQRQTRAERWSKTRSAPLTTT